MSETNVDPTNCLDIIEQLRYDRDKYIGMWRSQCNIAEEVMKERDRYKAALAEVMEEYGHKCAKCGSVLQLVRPGKHQCQYCEMESALTAELDRYKQGVEMDGEVRCILLAKSEGTCGKAQIIIPIIPIDDSILIGNRVRLLVMKEEE